MLAVVAGCASTATLNPANMGTSIPWKRSLTNRARSLLEPFRQRGCYHPSPPRPEATPWTLCGLPEACCRKLDAWARLHLSHPLWPAAGDGHHGRRAVADGIMSRSGGRYPPTPFIAEGGGGQKPRPCRGWGGCSREKSSKGSMLGIAPQDMQKRLISVIGCIV